MMQILLLITWVIFSCLEGSRDARYFHNQVSATKPVKENSHYIFFLERTIVFALTTYIVFLDTNILTTFFFSSGLILVFSFFHNGVYYTQRNKLNPLIYPKKFWDSSTTSQASIELNVKARVALFAIAVMSIIVSFLTNKL